MNTKTPECYTTDTQARCLRVELTATRLLVLPLDQFVFAELDDDGKEQNCVWFLPRTKSWFPVTPCDGLKRLSAGRNCPA